MKIILILILIQFHFVSNLYSKNWRVNNSPGISADFTTLQAAHDGATEGDSIYVEGSLTNYDNNGTVTISKKLNIIGPGYFLGQNPFTQANKMEAKFNYLNFTTGSEGSSVMGLTVRTIDVNIPDVVVRRNHINTLRLRSESFLVSQNFITWTLSGTNCSGIVTNNIIRYTTINSNSSVSIFNNLFHYTGSNSLDVHNSEVRNNIIYGYTENNLFAGGRNNTVTNNIFRQTGTDSDGNQFGQEVSSIILNEGSEDGKYLLTENSVAKGSGLNGVDCGPFGGDSPYELSGIPPGPSIYEVNAPATASRAEGLPVSIKIYSHP
ncbi:MAG: hypothetical protein WD431_01905 [Cyclobacteriaceae bacterium]